MNMPIICRLLSVCFIVLNTSFVFSQYYILGRGLDEEERPYAFAKAELRGEGIYREQTCTELGVFRFEDLKSGSYEIVLVTPYGVRRKKVELRGSIDVTLHIPRNIQIDEISVVARRAGSNEPVTHDNITYEELQQKTTGQDLPFLLEGSPSIVVTSDAGHGIGYTGLRIRGTDPTRINVTLNGIPVNDAESHNVFWVDLPDIAESTKSIQIQRGIGWSQPGSGELGGGIHLNTLSFHDEPYAGISFGAGSFGTKRGSVNLGSGLVKGRFTFDGRASYLHSDGYIDRAKTDLYSLYGSAGYHHDLTNVRFIFALGDELTYQAWNGVPEQYVFDPSTRTYNSAGTEKSVESPHDNEVDDYRQTHYQLHFDQAVTPFARWTNAVHYTRGIGFFEQYKADQNPNDYNLAGDTTTDVIRRRWLDNHFYGFTSTIQVGRPMKRYFVAGGGWNKYLGDHYGEVIWTSIDGDFFSPPIYYFNNAEKNDWNLFARSNLKITEKLHATIDLQNRWVHYAFEAPDENGSPIEQSVRHSFFNPKGGLHYNVSEKVSLYALTGIMHKEPNRDDYTESTPSSRPLPEKMWDTEAGFKYSNENTRIGLSGYYMDYYDQLVLTGRINDVGAYTRVNVERSHRAGIEADISFQPVKSLTIASQVTISRNKIKTFDEYIDNWDTGEQEIVMHQNTDIAFSPNFLAGVQTSYNLLDKPAHQITLELSGKFVGKQYVDNTSRTGSLLEEYFVTDAGLHWKWNNLWAKDFRISFFIKNIFNQQYESNGWIYRFRSPSFDPTQDDPYAGSEEGSLYHLKGYFPQAGRHLFVTLKTTF